MTVANRTPSSLRQKLGLVAFGLFLAVLVIETALRLGGVIILSLQNHTNAVALWQKGAYRILCIGESTTQRQYPSFLEQALNGKNMGIRFSVIDRGLGGSNSMFLVDRMEEDLETYHPDMVVAMMGINDYGPHMPQESETSLKIVRILRTLRIYKLARIAWMHIAGPGRRAGATLPDAAAAKPDTMDATAQAVEPRNERGYRDLGRARLQQGRLSEAAAAFVEALRHNPRSDGAHVELGLVWLSQGSFGMAEARFKKALEINDRNSEAYARLGWAYQFQGRGAEALAALKMALRIDPRNAEAYEGLGWVLRDQGRSEEATAAAKKALEFSSGESMPYQAVLWAHLLGQGSLSQKKNLSGDPVLNRLTVEFIAGKAAATSESCGALATAYAAMGVPGLARLYHKKAEQLRLAEYYQLTVRNYHRLKAMLDRRGVKLVCAQYPMRDWEPLKRIFQGEADGIVFVNNEKVFMDAVQRGSLREYFVDMFGGDFGHCTDRGNHLLAGNIADVIAREVFGK